MVHIFAQSILCEVHRKEPVPDTKEQMGENNFQIHLLYNIKVVSGKLQNTNPDGSLSLGREKGRKKRNTINGRTTCLPQHRLALRLIYQPGDINGLALLFITTQFYWFLETEQWNHIREGRATNLHIHHQYNNSETFGKIYHSKNKKFKYMFLA
ncbi:hypothetical protein E2C01_034944 [Portunus trituberculatus]|uniref:Uncharacterized protein n=1 Tax=Portunus trituberculatus TaxID=210409 RepID=A0A5B7F7R4_PORTR|nr:hypothetical protein [Portunus trituberculatus]